MKKKIKNWWKNLNDKRKHYLVGVAIPLAIGFPLFLIFLNPYFAVITGFACGILAAFGKETFDKNVKKTKFDWMDIAPTIFGTCLGTIALIVVIHSIFF